MKSVVVGLLTLFVLPVLLASSAAAQPAMTPPVAPAYAMPAVDAPQKSEGTAMMLALGATTLGYLAASTGDGSSDNAVLPWIAAAGILVGPSAGHIYAGENGHAVKMTLLRTGAMAVFAAGLIKSFSAAVDADCIDFCGHGDQTARNNGEMLMLVGAATFITASVYDLIDAPRAARRANAKAKERTWQVAPTMSRDAGGGVAPAFAVSGRW